MLVELLRPFVVKMGMMAEESYQELTQLLLTEMRMPDFCAVSYPLTVWGTTPI